jgi:hypothetical protein
MEALKRREYETELSGRTNLLGPSNPSALSFADDQSIKAFLSKAAGTTYTILVQESIGDTKFMPADDEIDSQESDLFRGYENDGFIEDPFHDEDGGIIANMDLLKTDGPKNASDATTAMATREMADKEDDAKLSEGAMKILSPGKINRKVMNFDEIPKKPSAGQHEVIHNMLREWVETHNTKEPLPPVLRSLAN